MYFTWKNNFVTSKHKITTWLNNISQRCVFDRLRIVLLCTHTLGPFQNYVCVHSTTSRATSTYYYPHSSNIDFPQADIILIRTLASINFWKAGCTSGFNISALCIALLPSKGWYCCGMSPAILAILLSFLVATEGSTIQWKKKTGYDNSPCSDTWFFPKTLDNGSTACECGSKLST